MHMDESTVAGSLVSHPRAMPFEGQRICVVPRTLVENALRDPGTRRVTVTDVGYFPQAAGHHLRRSRGLPEAILIVTTAGKGRVAMGSRIFDLEPGQSIVVPEGIPHEYAASDDAPWSIWWCHLRGTDVGELVQTIDAPVRVRSLGKVVALFQDLALTLERGQSPAHLLQASGIAWNLVTTIASGAALPVAGGPVERALGYLNERLDRRVSVAEVAAQVGFSSSHLSALVREATGGGVLDYHISARMARARLLLDTTASSVAAIGRRVGYSDPLYFSRQFRSIHGISPSTGRSEDKG